MLAIHYTYFQDEPAVSRTLWQSAQFLYPLPATQHQLDATLGPLGQPDTQKNTNAHGSRPPGTGAHATAKDAGKAFAAGNRRAPSG